MENEAQLKQANRIVGYFERHGALTIRELRVKGVRIDLGQLRELLAQLVAIGDVTAQAAPSGATGGRPTIRYAAVELRRVNTTTPLS